MTQRRNISLPDQLDSYVDKTNLNLSRFVQDKLREHREQHGFQQASQIED